MVRTSGIRDKLRSDVLKELAKERGLKRSRPGDDGRSTTKNSEDQDNRGGEEDEDELNTLNRLNQERRMKRARESKSTLLQLLPEPKNSSAFGATIKLDKLLKMPERADNVELQQQASSEPSEGGGGQLNEDGMLEVDVNKYLTDQTPSAVKDLTVEKAAPVIVPKGKEKQKNQITYLAQLGKATELERKEQAAQGRANRSAARSKYGW